MSIPSAPEITLATQFGNPAYCLCLGYNTLTSQLVLFSTEESWQYCPTQRVASRFFGERLLAKWVGSGLDSHHYSAVWSGTPLCGSSHMGSRPYLIRARRALVKYFIPFGIHLEGKVIEYLVPSDDDVGAGLSQVVYATPGAIRMMTSLIMPSRSLGRARGFHLPNHWENYFQGSSAFDRPLFELGKRADSGADGHAWIRVEYMALPKVSSINSAVFYKEHALSYVGDGLTGTLTRLNAPSNSHHPWRKQNEFNADPWGYPSLTADIPGFTWGGSCLGRAIAEDEVEWSTRTGTPYAVVLDSKRAANSAKGAVEAYGVASQDMGQTTRAAWRQLNLIFSAALQVTLDQEPSVWQKMAYATRVRNCLSIVHFTTGIERVDSGALRAVDPLKNYIYDTEGVFASLAGELFATPIRAVVGWNQAGHAASWNLITASGVTSEDLQNGEVHAVRPRAGYPNDYNVSGPWGGIEDARKCDLAAATGFLISRSVVMNCGNQQHPTVIAYSYVNGELALGTVSQTSPIHGRIGMNLQHTYMSKGTTLPDVVLLRGSILFDMYSPPNVHDVNFKFGGVSSNNIGHLMTQEEFFSKSAQQEVTKYLSRSEVY